MKQQLISKFVELYLLGDFEAIADTIVSLAHIGGYRQDVYEACLFGLDLMKSMQTISYAFLAAGIKEVIEG